MEEWIAKIFVVAPFLLLSGICFFMHKDVLKNYHKKISKKEEPFE